MSEDELRALDEWRATLADLERAADLSLARERATGAQVWEIEHELDAARERLVARILSAAQATPSDRGGAAP